MRLAKAIGSHDDNKVLAFLRDVVQEDARGLAIFGEVQDEASGILTLNAATLSIEENETVLGLDIRYPVTIEKDFIVEKLETAAEKAGLIYEEYDFIAPLYVPLDHPLVENLMAVYQEKTGDMSEALVSGGATFARTMDNCVAFGAQLPQSEATLHGPNERVALADFYQSMDIYAEALYRLTCEK